MNAQTSGTNTYAECLLAFSRDYSSLSNSDLETTLNTKHLSKRLHL